MDYIFNNKKKNAVAICFSLFYVVMLILNMDFSLPLFQDFRYAINSLFISLTPLVAPVLILVLIFTREKEYRLKMWLLPIAFGMNLALFLLTLISNIATIKLLFSAPKYLPLLLCSFLMCIAIAFIFFGTLFNLRFVRFVKYGALCCSVLLICSAIIDFINVGGFAYIQSVPAEYSAVSIVALMQIVSNALFYMGIFILTTNKRN